MIFLFWTRPTKSAIPARGIGGSVGSRRAGIVPAVVLTRTEPHRTTLEGHEALRPVRSLPPDFPGLSSRHPRGSRRFVPLFFRHSPLFRANGHSFLATRHSPLFRATGRKSGLFSPSISPSFVLSRISSMISAASNWPGRPGWSPTQSPPQIRTCRFPASGSSPHDFAAWLSSVGPLAQVGGRNDVPGVGSQPRSFRCDRAGTASASKSAALLSETQRGGPSSP